MKKEYGNECTLMRVYLGNKIREYGDMIGYTV